MTGKFITFEGGEACGKSTAIQAIAARLREGGTTVLQLREPGGTAFGEAMRDAVKNPLLQASPLAQLFAFNAARAQLVEEQIRPALARGETVLCDRYFHSSIVYQQSEELDPKKIMQMCSIATGGLHPDLTLLFDLPVDVAVQRIESSRAGLPDRFDSAGKPTMQAWRDRYLGMRDSFSYFKVVDGQDSREKVVDGCLAHIDALDSAGAKLVGGRGAAKAPVVNAASKSGFAI